MTQLGTSKRIREKMTKLSQLTHEISSSKQEVKQQLEVAVTEARREAEVVRREAEVARREAEVAVAEARRQTQQAEARAQDLEARLVMEQGMTERKAIQRAGESDRPWLVRRAEIHMTSE